VISSDTVPFAVWCAASNLASFEAACWQCVEVGGDIDTTCAMVGGIIVGAVGLEGIPAAWREAREPLPI
jgi:ADP-ribosylglycohydrolase